jgi:hypothetical protein
MSQGGNHSSPREHFQYVLPKQESTIRRLFCNIHRYAKRWLFPQRKDRHFLIAFLFRSVPGKWSVTKEPYLQVTNKGAVELTNEEFERRTKVKPEEKVLIEARKIINPVLTN